MYTLRFCLEISPEIQLDYRTYKIGRRRKDLCQGTCYLIAGYEYIRNRSINQRTFLRCRNRKKCFAKATIIHQTNKAVITCSEHTHPPPEDIPEEESNSGLVESSKASTTAVENIAPTNFTCIKQEMSDDVNVRVKQEATDEFYVGFKPAVPEESSLVQDRVPFGTVGTNRLSEQSNEAKAPSVDGSGGIGSRTEDETG